ncbi:ribosomal protein L1 [Westerdykella ornata]|uniref:Ribosomal protein L1 n=1 Tax=Westerdykella ornata TaxID=318751 RepID=A0A6A6JRN7_WESOR|nr:ribosomal protein L1 [Westerdykella ornata]KAF2279281.1 ribosomal protein L1 [Westerdykella ornata]
MAKSKAVTKKETTVSKKEHPASAAAAPLTTKVANGSPYQLDPAQVERAATALIKNMKQHAQEKQEIEGKKNLLADDEEEAEQTDVPIFLTLATKQHIKEETRLKPSKIALPHSIQPADVRICLMTADPQRQFKDLVAHDSFPADLRAKIGRVIGVEKLKKKYKTYETRRQLLAEYDLFLADDRIISELPHVLGKTFNANKSKRPIPVGLTMQLPKDKDGKRKRVVRSPDAIAKEIESALHSTYVHLSPTATTAIRVGKLSQQPQQIVENIEAVVAALTGKFVPRGWRNVRALHIKGPTTVALPIWLADELWADEAQVLEEPWKPAIKDASASKTSEKKRKWEEWEKEILDDEELAERRERRRREKKRKSKEEGDAAKVVASISKERRKKLKQQALESIKTPLIAG